MEEKRDNEWDSNWEHMFPRDSGYKRSDIEEVHITEFRVQIV